MKRLPLVVLCALLLSGSTPQLPNNGVLERELQSLTDRGLRVQLLGEVVEASDPVSGQKWQFPTRMLTPRQPGYIGLPTLTIDLRTLDTNLYNWKYHYVNSFPLSSTWGFPLLVKDVDRNGMYEAYGIYQTQADVFTRIYELNSDKEWNLTHTYPQDTGVPDKGGDLDGNKLQEVHFRYRDSLFIYEQSSFDDLPAKVKLRYRQWFYGATGIPNQVHDMNNDGIDDLIFRGSELDTLNPKVSIDKDYIAVYDTMSNGLVRIFAIQLPLGCSGFSCASSIAVDDFDGDSRPEFVTSTTNGDVYSVEFDGTGGFAHNWSGSVDAGMRAASGDVDGNGLIEFFQGGGRIEQDGFGHLKIYAFEAQNDNDYIPFFCFDIFPVGLFFVDLFQTADIDGDGISELLLSFSGGTVIIKRSGIHNYGLFYYKAIDHLDAVSAITIAAQNGAHLFVSRAIGSQDTIRWTDVYSLDTSLVAAVERDHTPNSSTLSQNFPNPFNGSTTISYTIPVDERVTLKVFDLLGREVVSLVDGRVEAGSHAVTLDASRLASGLYFYRLTAGKFTDVKKLVLMK